MPDRPPPSLGSGIRRRAAADPTRWAAAALAVAAGLPTAGLTSDVAASASGLDAPVTALWTSVPLRDWATRASLVAGLPVVIDRRLDPGIVVTRECRGEPLASVLAAVAADAGGAVEPRGSWVAIVPAAAAGRATRAARLRAAEIAALPPASRARLVRAESWSWPDGARPRDLVSVAAAAAGVVVADLMTVPHDHLPAASLPELPLAERLDLVLAQYDLRVAWSADATRRAVGRIVALPDARVPGATSSGDALPDAGAAADSPRGIAAATRRRAGGTDPPRTEKRYTLALAAPLDEAVAKLAPQLGLEAAIDRESLAARGILPGEIVRATVTDATRDEVLDALVSPLGLRWRIDGRRLVIDAPAP